MEGWLVQVDQRGTHCMDGAIHRDPQATARWALSSQHHPHSVDARGSALKSVGWRCSLLLTLPLLIVQLLQEMAAWALRLLRVEAFVLTWAVRRCAGFVSGPKKACSSKCHCAFISGPTCSVSSTCKACVTLCVCSQNKHSNTLFCIFFSIRKPEQNKPV